MNNALFAACGALALASTMTLSAQTPPLTPAPPGGPQVSAPAESEPKPTMGAVTMTGCLNSVNTTTGTAEGGTMAKSSTTFPGSAMPGARYTLTDVAMDGPARGGSMGTPTTGAPAPGGAGVPPHAMATQYAVVGGSGVDLSAHVGHKVTVTGTVAEAHAGMPGMKSGDEPMDKPEMPATRPGDAPKSRPMGMGHMGANQGWSTLTASSITMISTTCTAAQ